MALELLTTRERDDDLLGLQADLTSAVPPSNATTVSIHYPPPRRLPTWFNDLATEAVALTRLPPGWDSYDAAPIAAECVASALGLLLLVSSAETPQPDVIPTIDGGVAFEWSLREYSLEIEVRGPGQASLFFEDFHTGEEHGVEEVDADSAREFVSRLAD